MVCRIFYGIILSNLVTIFMVYRTIQYIVVVIVAVVGGAATLVAVATVGERYCPLITHDRSTHRKQEGQQQWDSKQST